MSDITLGDVPWTMDPDEVIGEFLAVVENASPGSLVASKHQWSRTSTGVRLVFCGIPMAALLEADPVEGTQEWECRIWFLPNINEDTSSVVLALTVLSALEDPYCTVDVTDIRGRVPETELEERAMKPRGNEGWGKETSGRVVYRALYVTLERQHALFETELLRSCAPGLIVHKIDKDGYINLTGRWHGYRIHFIYHRRSIMYLEVFGDNEGEQLMWSARFDRSTLSPTTIDGQAFPEESREVLERLERDHDVDEMVSERDLTYLIAGCASRLERIKFNYRFSLTEFSENVPLAQPVKYLHVVQAYTLGEALETITATASENTDFSYDPTPSEFDMRSFPSVMPSFTVVLP